MLNNPYLVAVVIPLILILCGGLAKKLVRGSAFSPSDFFLGVELSLSALGSGLTNLFDISKSASNSQGNINPNGVTQNGSFVAICFFLLLVVLALHQEWEKRTQDPNGQIFWLGFLSNALGAGLMVIFILLVKGI